MEETPPEPSDDEPVAELECCEGAREVDEEQPPGADPTMEFERTAGARWGDEDGPPEANPTAELERTVGARWGDEDPLLVVEAEGSARTAGAAAMTGTCNTDDEPETGGDGAAGGVGDAAKGNTVSWKTTWREVKTRREARSKHL